MANYNGSTNTIISPAFSPFGAPTIRFYQESTCASSKIIKRGDPVCFDTVITTHARILVAPSSQGAAGNLMQNGITSFLGIALADSTSDGSTTGLLPSTDAGNSVIRQIPVAINDGLTEFAISISSVGAAPFAVSSTMIGITYPVERIAALDNRYFLSSTNLSTAADLSFVVTTVPTGNVGDTGGVVWGKFHSTMSHKSIRTGPAA
jgi:hypothetical protein